MLSVPLVWREMLVQSRARATYDARIGWGLAIVGVLGILAWNFPNQSSHGYYVLSGIHACFALTLFLLAPIGAADCLSREKREGTLGLLLLTQLTPAQIVLGKLAAHLLRLFYFSLMMAPFLVLPVLIGGVDFHDFLLSAVVLFAIVAAGLTGGIVASSLCASSGLALSFAVMGATLGVLALGCAFTEVLCLGTRSPALREAPWVVRIFVIGGGVLVFPFQGREIASRFAVPPSFFSGALAGLWAISLLLLWFGFRFATRLVARQGVLAIESQRQAAFRKRFLTPILGRRALRRSMSRKLDRNPLVWLEYRTAWARAARWAMISLIVCAEIGLWLDFPPSEGVQTAQFWMLAGLVAFLALKSAHSFHAEKESGAFELLLVTPTTERKLVFGRLRALSHYYILAIGVLLLFSALAFYFSEHGSFIDPNLSNAVFQMSLCASLLSVPCSGLFFALRSRGFVPALLWTVGVSLLALPCAWTAFSGVLWIAVRNQWPPAVSVQNALQEIWWPVLLGVALYHLLAAGLSTKAALDLLKERNFGQRQ